MIQLDKQKWSEIISTSLRWKHPPANQPSSSPFFHDVTSHIFLLTLPTSQFYRKVLHVFCKASLTPPPQRGNLLRFLTTSHTCSSLFCPYPIKWPEPPVNLLYYPVYSLLHWWSPPSPLSMRCTLLMCCINTWLLPPLHYFWKHIQDAYTTPDNRGNHVSVSRIDCICWDQDSSFNQHEDKDESETLGDTKRTDIWNSIALKGEVVTTTSELPGLQTASVWASHRTATICVARQHCLGGSFWAKAPVKMLGG